jgi:hypothetical protein
MKTFYEYLDEQKNMHESKSRWGAAGLGAGLALGIGVPAALRTTTPTTQISTQNPIKISPAKILADKLKHKYGPEINSLNYIIKSIEIDQERNMLHFKGSATNFNDDDQKEFENKLKRRMERLISSEGKIENFKIRIVEKLEKYIEKNDKANIIILNAANQYAEKTGGELEVKQDPLGTFYFINYKNKDKINFLSDTQIGGMTKGDIISKFGVDINILEKSNPNQVEFTGNVTVLE